MATVAIKLYCFLLSQCQCPVKILMEAFTTPSFRAIDGAFDAIHLHIYNN